MMDGDDGEQGDSFYHQLHPEAIEQIIEQQQFFNPSWTLGNRYIHVSEGEEKKRSITYPVSRPYGISEGLDQRYASMNGSSTSILVSPLEVFASSDSAPSIPHILTGSSSTDTSSLPLTPRSPRIGGDRGSKELTPEAPIHSPRGTRRMSMSKKVRKPTRGRKNRYTDYWTYEDELKWGQAWQYEMRRKLARKMEPTADPPVNDPIPIRSQSVPHQSSYQHEQPSNPDYPQSVQSTFPES